MKIRILLCFLLLGSIENLNAQVSITSAIFPNIGDTVRYAVDNLPANTQITSPGGMQNWDYSSLQADLIFQQIFETPDSGQSTDLFPEANLLSRIFQGVETYSLVTESKMETIGAFGEDPVGFGVNLASRFDPPLLEYMVPINYLDSVQSQSSLAVPFASSDLPDTILSILPFVPDSFRIRANFSRLDITDAWGTLQIPEGFYEVLRQKRTESLSFSVEAKVIFIGWQDITDLVLPFLGGAMLPQDTLISYRFLSNENKDVLLSFTMDSLGVEVLNAQYVSSQILTDLDETKIPTSHILAYPNPTTEKLYFQKQNIESGDYVLETFSFKGQLLAKRRFNVIGPNLNESIDISNLQAGIYWFVWRNMNTGILLDRAIKVVKE